VATVQPSLPFNTATPNTGSLNALVLEVVTDKVPQNALYMLRRWFMPWEICQRIEIQHKVRISDSSCTARIRDLRKAQFGAHVIEKRIRKGSKAYEYRLVR
jgi:hypothetical protein